MKKRVVAMLLALVMVMGAFPTAALAADTVASGTSTDGLEWILDSEGTLTISGRGRMRDYPSSTNAPWRTDELRPQIRKAVIGEGITYLGQFAFLDCTNMEEISLPDTLTGIGQQVFQGCSGLLSADIPDSVTAIGRWAFSGCSGLRQVRLPAGLGTAATLTDRKIAQGAFQNCSSLESVVLPAGVRSIENLAFCDCAALKSIEIPDGVVTIGDNSLARTGLVSLTLPDTVTSIGQYGLFNSTSLTSLKLSSGLKSIGYHALDNIAVTSLTIPGTVATIGDSAACWLTECKEMILEEGVTTIKSWATYDCPKLEALYIPASVTSIEENAFVRLADTLVIYGEPGSYAEEYAASMGIPFNGRFAASRELSVAVCDETGAQLESGYGVKWYADDAPIGEGNKIVVPDDSRQYSFEIILGEELLCQYHQPERQTVQISEDQTQVTVTLTPLAELTVTGRVLAAGGAALGAQAAFTQVFGGVYTRTVTAAADGNGLFSAVIKNVPTSVRISAEGYYDAIMDIGPETEPGVLDLGDCRLTPLPKSRVKLTLTLAAAAAAGDTPVETAITSADALHFAVYNQTAGAEVTGFTVQYPYILFEGGVSAGDTLAITAAGAAESSSTAQGVLTLDGEGSGEVELRFIQNGKFQVELDSATPTTVMLFDAGGTLVRWVNGEGKYTSRSLPAGTYQVVLLKKTDLLRSVSSVSTLSELGLVPGSDYAAREVAISNGVITRLGKITVPALDESKLYYTDADQTGTSINYTSAPVGKYITMRIEYALKPEHAAAASGEYVTVELPSGLETVGVPTVDGEAAQLTQAGDTVRIQVDKARGVVRFCFLATRAGSYDMTAYLHFQSGEAAAVQPLGSVQLKAEAAKIYVPATTGSQTVAASGLALAGSTVTVYDNGERAGEATANAAGKWQLSYPLPDAGKYVCHSVYAVIENAAFGEPITTETAQMIYDAAYVGVSRVTMYNTADGVEQKTVFDYLEPHRGLGYYVMTDANFSFVIEFQDSISRVSDVKLNVFAETGEVYTYDTVYDAENSRYLAAVSGVVPVNVGVEYHCATSADFDYSVMSPKEVDAYLVEAANSVEELLEIRDAGSIGEAGYITVGLVGSDDPDHTFDVVLTPLDYGDFSAETLEARGFAKDEAGGVYYVLHITESVVEYIFVNSKKESAFSVGVGYDLPSPEAPAMLSLARDAVGTMTFNQRLATDLAEKMPLPLLPEFTAMTDYRYLSDLVESKHSELLKKASNLEMKLEMWKSAVCPDTGAPRISAEEAVRAGQMLENIFRNEEYRYLYWKSMLDDVYRTKILNAFAMDVMSLGVGKMVEELVQRSAVIQKLCKKLPGRVQSDLDEIKDWYIDTGDMILALPENLHSYLDAWGDGLSDASGYDLPTQSGFWDFDDVYGSPYYLSILDAYSDAQTDEIAVLDIFINRAISECSDEPQPEDPDGKAKSPCGDKGVKRDPSGFVCEAVASNRLEGVTATLYYKANETSDAVKWNASDYGEVNPVETDANGKYRWDVPAGLWQVKYEKSGYETACSEWLPVPPPQTEVNAALVSTAAPEVKSVTAYESGVRVEFSQYMKLDSVTAQAITIKSNGAAIQGTVKPVNAEAGFGDPGTQYASIFLFQPEQKLTGSVTVRVSGAESYNGKHLASDYQADKAVVVRPTGMTTVETAAVVYGSSALLTVQIQPAEAAAGRTIQVASSAPSIVSVSQSTITADENGAAAVRVNGNLLGTGVITFSMDGSELTASTTVTVTTDAVNRCEKVESSIPSGSTAAYGTMLTLTTKTEGAAIYYTLDRSCPCVEDNPARRLYTGPILLTEDVFLIAYAVKDGYEDSPTAGFEIHVAAVPAPVDPIVPIEPAPGPVHDPVWVNPYGDVSTDNWFYNEVAYVSAKGLMKGVTSAAFAPNADTNRAMIWTILARMSGQNVDGGAPWYAQAQSWAVTAGVSDGTDPLRAVTRQELAAMLYRYAGSPDLTDAQLAALSRFSDGDSVSAYAERAMAWAVSNGIIRGMDGKLAPKDGATRAQVATMLMRFCQLMDK